MTRKRLLWIGAVVLLLVGSIALTAANMQEPLKRNEDKEFASGTPIRIGELTTQQQESLYQLCKVWGFVKYHHPSVVDGTLNWDAELFRVMPSVLAADNREEVNETLIQWLNQFPFEVNEPDEDARVWIAFQEESGGFSLDTSWISDQETLGAPLSSYLERISKTYITERSHAYAAFDDQSPYVNFKLEHAMPCTPEDDGTKLLSLFRFWNLYEYYSPNVGITKKDWDSVLYEAIPRLLGADSYRDYVLAVSEVTAMTGDAHISVFELEQVLRDYYGTYSLPCSFQNVDGNVVVSAVAEQQVSEHQKLKPGDIITAIDGTTIEERIATLSRYMALPEPDKFTAQLQNRLLKTEQEQAEVTIIRNGKTEHLPVKATKTPYRFKNPYQNGLMEQEQIGYIDPSALKQGDLEKLMKQFADTAGIIVDLRYYPSVFLPYLLGEYITPEPKQFARMSFPNRAMPGSFFYSDGFYSGKGIMNQMSGKGDYPQYHGKVILLMDETSMSQSEFTIMALRQSPNAIVVGSPSIGADGNVVSVLLPGGLKFSISGLGVYTPDGGETQRIGLQPDIECRPTVEGLRDGRDELVEKAVELIIDKHPAIGP